MKLQNLLLKAKSLFVSLTPAKPASKSIFANTRFALLFRPSLNPMRNVQCFPAKNKVFLFLLLTANLLCTKAIFASGETRNFAGTNALTLAGNTVAAANVCAGTTKNSILGFTLTDANTGGSGGSNPVVSAISFTTTGTYAAADLVNFKLWTNTSNSLSGATLLSTLTTGLGTGSHSFTGLSKSITVNGGSYYFWITVDVASTATNNNTITASALATSNITFSTAPTTTSGSASAGGTQTLKASPTTASAGSSQSICASASAVLSANTPLTGTGAWSVSSGPSTSTAQFSDVSSPTATFTPAGGTGSYTLTWTITNGSCTSTSTVIITVNAVPTITTSASATSVCYSTSAQTTTLSYSATTGSPTSYSISWNASPANSFSAVSNTTLPASKITITVPAGTSPGTYTGMLTVKNAGGCVSTAKTFTVTVNSLPTAFTFTGPDGATSQFCSDGSAATFTLSGSQTGVTYTFTSINPGGNTPPGQSFDVAGVGGTMNFTKTPDGNWSYEVVATDNTTGCTNTMNGVVKAIDKATVTQTPSTVSVCTNSSSQTISVTTANAKSLTWQVSSDNGSNWGTVSAGTNYAITTAANYSTSSLIVSNFTASMNGYIYRVAVGSASPCGTTYSTGTTLSVTAAPSITTQPASKTVCYNSTMTLSVTASNATSYQWYKNGSVVSGATASSYSKTFDPATDAASYYVVVSGASPCGSVTSSTAVVTAGSSTTWQGLTSGSTPATATAWEAEANWTCGVPTSQTDAVIPANIVDGYPTLKSTVNGEVRNLSIVGGTFGAYLTVEGKLSIYGTVTNSGGVFTASNGTVEFAGSTAQAIPASLFDGNTVKYLVISNDVSLAGSLGITGALSFGSVNNKTFATADYLTLKSSSAATARVADLTNNGVNSGNSVTGNVTVESYMPSHRRYRLVTSPVQGTTINSAWQEGRTWNGTTAESSQYGTLITGGSQGNVTNANNNGFDFWVASSNFSVYRYSGSFNVSSNTGASWVGVSNTKQYGFDNNEAYLLFVRGDRTVTAGSGTTVLRGKGPLKETASQTATVYKQSHTLIGNPFASPLNFKAIYDANSSTIQPYYWIWQASLGSGTGGYVLMEPNGSGGYEAVPSVGSGSVDPVIGSGEGFFVVPAADASLPATVTIQQKHKATGSASFQTFRQMGAGAGKIRVNVFADIAGERTLLDGVMVRYEDGATDADDVVKANNGSENLSVRKGDRDLIVSSSSLPVSNDTVQLRLWNTAAKTYRMEVGSNGFSVPNQKAILVDRFLKTETLLNMDNGVTPYAFSVTGDAASKDPLRFFIVLQPAVQVTLPLQLAGASASEKEKGVEVKWNLADESGVKGYAVEKSADGTAFTVLAEAKATAQSGPAAYTVVDEKPFSIGYYRVKMIGTNGESKYSSVMKVRLERAGEAMSVFPNPVSGGVINLQLVNKPAGDYQLNLFNAVGQRVWTRGLQHNGGSVAASLLIGTKIPSGVYTLHFASPTGESETLRVQVVQ